MNQSHVKDAADRAEKRGRGRPTDYRAAYCDEVVDHLGQGLSLASFGGEIGVSRDTLYEWMDRHQDFSDAVKKGRSKGMLTWERRLANQADNASGNTAAMIFAMKNLYQADWSDKTVNEHTGKDGGPVEVTDARERLAHLLAGATSARPASDDPGGADG